MTHAPLGGHEHGVATSHAPLALEPSGLHHRCCVDTAEQAQAALLTHCTCHHTFCGAT